MITVTLLPFLNTLTTVDVIFRRGNSTRCLALTYFSAFVPRIDKSVTLSEKLCSVSCCDTDHCFSNFFFPVEKPQEQLFVSRETPDYRERERERERKELQRDGC
jgi:hypothetical protein